MASRCLLLLLLLFVCCHQVPATDPGFKIRLSQSTLDIASTIGANLLTDYINNHKQIEVQPIHEEWAGSWFTAYLEEVELTDFEALSGQVTVNPGSGLSWNLNSQSASIQGNWRYDAKVALTYYHSHGTFEVSLDGIGVEADAIFGYDPNTGHPTVTAGDCPCNIDHVDIDLQGGTSWLLRLFIKQIEKAAGEAIESGIRQATRDAIQNTTETQLAQLPVTVQLMDDLLTFDYSFLSAPLFADNYVETSNKGEFFLSSQPSTEAPYQPTPLPSPSTTDHMLTVWVSEYTLQTAVYVLYEAGIMNRNITRENLGKQGDVLNTTCALMCIGNSITALRDRYPNAFVEINAFVTSPPIVSITTTDVYASFVATAIFNVRLSDGSAVFVFQVDLTAGIVGGCPHFDGTTVTAKFDTLNATLSVTNSTIGRVDPVNLSFFFNVAAKNFILPMMNAVGEKGFMLPPIPYVHLTNSDIQLNDQYIALITGLQ